MRSAPHLRSGRGAGRSVEAGGHRRAKATATPPIETVLVRLDGVVETRPGEWRAFSPGQENRKGRALAIKEGDDGRVLLHDFAGRDVREILDAIGLEFGDLFPQDYRAPNRQRREMAWKPSISPRDALQVLSVESLVIFILGRQVADLEDVTREDYLRCREAVRRIQAVRSCV